MFDKIKAKTILLDLHQLLDRFNIEHALICGTALGVYRNNDFLSEDIDILCNAKDYWKVRYMVDCTPAWEYNCIWRREIALFKYGRKIDVLFADIEDETSELMSKTHIYIYKPNSITGKYHTEQRYTWDTSDIFPYAQIEFLGSTFNIPNNCPAFFEKYYGLNWKTPIVDWNRDKYPPPNLDKDYRQIDIFVDFDRYPLSARSCQEVYDSDWVRVLNQNYLHENLAPLIVEIVGNFLFTKEYDLNILNEILLSDQCIRKVIAKTASNLKTRKSPTSRANIKGYSFYDNVDNCISVSMIENCTDGFIIAETEEFFNVS